MSGPRLFHAPKLVSYLTHAVALAGEDGWPSFTKIVIVGVVGSYFLKAGVPELVATMAILASHGLKPLMQWVTLRFQHPVPPIPTTTTVTVDTAHDTP